MKNCFIDQWLLRKIVAESPYALMYTCGDEQGRLGLPVIIKADETQHPRFLFCTTDDGNDYTESLGKFPVVLRFINKQKGNFIRVQGIASVLSKRVSDNGQEAQTTCIELETLQIAWVYKKSGKVEFYI